MLSLKKRFKISIITPSYNAEKYISETINSIISQAGDFDIEYIIADGNSTDNTINIVNSIIKKIETKEYPVNCNSIKMSLISESDNGMYDALSKGLQIVTGDVVSYLNSDDYFFPNVFQNIANIFDRNNKINWISGIPCIMSNYGFVVDVYLHTITFFDNKFIRMGLYDGRTLPFIQQESTFFRRNALDNINMHELKELKLAGDFYLWKNLAEYYPLFALKSIVGSFRLHKGNLSKSIEEYYKEMEEVKSKSETLNKNDLNFLRQLKKAYYGFVPNNRRLIHWDMKNSRWQTNHLAYDLNYRPESFNNPMPYSFKTDNIKDMAIKNNNNKYKKDISIVLGSYNRIQLLKNTINSCREEIYNNPNLKFEIIVVDGGSDDGSIDWLIQQKDIITIIQHNKSIWDGKELERKSWGYFMNLAFKSSKGKYICMISDDTILHSNAIKNGYELFEKELNQGEKIGAVAFYFNDWPLRKDYAVANNIGHIYVNHGLFLKEALEEINYADEDNFNFYGADTDIIIMMKTHGYKCIVSENSYVEHFNHENLGTKNSNIDSNKANNDNEALISKWEGVLYDKNQANEFRKKIGYWIYSKNKKEKNIGFKDYHSEKISVNKSINVVHLVTLLQGGAYNACLDLHKVLSQFGYYSKILTIDSVSSRDKSTFVYMDTLQTFKPISKLINSYKYYYRNKDIHLNKDIKDKYELFTGTRSFLRIEKYDILQNADIIHLHWPAWMINYSTFFKSLKNKKFVWTLHDMNPFTGGCHYSYDCKKFESICSECPQIINTNKPYYSNENFEIKSRAYSSLKHVHIVGVSDWITEQSKKSKIFGNFPHSTIGNIIDTNNFFPEDKESAKLELGIDNHKKTILFVAPSFIRYNKGSDIFISSLKFLDNKDNIQIILKGQHVNNIAKNIFIEYGISVKVYSYSRDINELRLLYSAADVCCVPSRYETFSLVTAESMACGTPVVAFDSTGPSSIIKHKVDGYLAKSYDTEDFANGIKWALYHHNTKLLQNLAIQRIKDKYKSRIIVDQYRNIYKSFF